MLKLFNIRSKIDIKLKIIIRILNSLDNILYHLIYLIYFRSNILHVIRLLREKFDNIYYSIFRLPNTIKYIIGQLYFLRN
jgi:hypothetical protein